MRAGEFTGHGLVAVLLARGVVLTGVLARGLVLLGVRLHGGVLGLLVQVCLHLVGCGVAQVVWFMDKIDLSL